MITRARAKSRSGQAGSAAAADMQDESPGSQHIHRDSEEGSARNSPPNFSSHFSLDFQPWDDSKEEEESDEEMDSINVTPKSAATLASPKFPKTAKSFPTFTTVPSIAYGCGRLR